MDARHQAEEIVAQARSSADVVAEERRQQLLTDVSELEARREAVGRNASVLDAHLVRQRERLQGLSSDIAALLDRGDRLGDLAPPDLVAEPKAEVSREPKADEAPVAPPSPQAEALQPAPASELSEPTSTVEPAAEATPAEQVEPAPAPFRSRANSGRVAPPVSPAESGSASEGGPPTEQIDMGDLLAGPPTPEPARRR